MSLARYGFTQQEWEQEYKAAKEIKQEYDRRNKSPTFELIHEPFTPAISKPHVPEIDERLDLLFKLEYKDVQRYFNKLFEEKFPSEEILLLKQMLSTFKKDITELDYLKEVMRHFFYIRDFQKSISLIDDEIEGQYVEINRRKINILMIGPNRYYYSTLLSRYNEIKNLFKDYKSSIFNKADRNKLFPFREFPEEKFPIKTTGGKIFLPKIFIAQYILTKLKKVFEQYKLTKESEEQFHFPASYTKTVYTNIRAYNHFPAETIQQISQLFEDYYAKNKIIFFHGSRGHEFEAKNIRNQLLSLLEGSDISPIDMIREAKEYIAANLVSVIEKRQFPLYVVNSSFVKRAHFAITTLVNEELLLKRKLSY